MTKEGKSVYANSDDGKVRQNNDRTIMCLIMKHTHTHTYIYIYIKGKGKVIPLQARCGPEGG